MGVFLKIISILIIVGAIVITTSVNQRRMVTRWQNSDDGTYKKLSKLYTVIPVAFAVFLFVLSSSFVIIPTGYTGVRSTF